MVIQQEVNLLTLIEGRQDALETAIRKLRTDGQYILDDIKKGNLSKLSYQRLVKFQDECYSALRSVEVLTTLFVIRDFGPAHGPVAEQVDATVSNTVEKS